MKRRDFLKGMVVVPASAAAVPLLGMLPAAPVRDPPQEAIEASAKNLADKIDSDIIESFSIVSPDDIVVTSAERQKSEYHQYYDHYMGLAHVRGNPGKVKQFNMLVDTERMDNDLAFRQDVEAEVRVTLAKAFSSANS